MLSFSCNLKEIEFSVVFSVLILIKKFTTPENNQLSTRFARILLIMNIAFMR